MKPKPGYRRGSYVVTQSQSNCPDNKFNNTDWLDFGTLLRIARLEGEPEANYVERVRKANDQRLENL